MASILAALLPSLMGAGATAGGLSGMRGLANMAGLGSMAGSTMGAGMQGATQGSGLLGMLSGGGTGALSNGLYGAPSMPTMGSQSRQWSSMPIIKPEAYPINQVPQNKTGV